MPDQPDIDFDSFLDAVGAGIPDPSVPVLLPEDAPQVVRDAERRIASLPEGLFIACRTRAIAFSRLHPTLHPTQAYMLASYYVSSAAYIALTNKGEPVEHSQQVADAVRVHCLSIALSDGYRSEKNLPLLP